MSGIYLRELGEADMALVNAWRRDREVTDLLCGPFRHVSIETDVAWFRGYASSRASATRLAICLRENDRHVGNLYLLDAQPIERACEFHILLGDRAQRGKGLGKEATILGLRHAFHDGNMHRVHLRVLAANTRAVSLYKKCGFTLEGVLRDAAFKNGKFLDVQLMSMLRDEFDARHGNG